MKTAQLFWGIALLGASMAMLASCKKAAIITPRPTATVLADPALPAGLAASPIVHLKANSGWSSSSWTDQSGNGNNASPVNSPTLTNGVLSGYPVVTFNGTNQYYTIPNITYGAFTIFMVGTQTGATDSPYEHSNGTQFDYLYTGTNASMGIKRTAEGDKKFAASWGSASARTLVGVFNSTFASMDIRINGVSKNTTTGDGTLTQYSSFGSDPGSGSVTGTFTLYNDTGFTTPVHGNLAELLIFNVALSVSDIQAVESYLRSKYGHY